MKFKLWAGIISLALSAVSFAEAQVSPDADTKNDKSKFDADYLKRAGTFLSNFTEVRIFNYTRQQLIDDKDMLVHFAVRHNWINNPKYFEMDPKCTNTDSIPEYCYTKGNVLISVSKLPAVTKRYLDYDMKEFPTVTDYTYEDGHYRSVAADGDAAAQVNLTEAERDEDGLVVLKGTITYPDCDDCIDPDNPPQVTAKLAERVYKGKDYWTFMSLEVTGLEPPPAPDEDPDQDD